MGFIFLSNFRENKKRPAGATLGTFWISKIVLELFHTMESRQRRRSLDTMMLQQQMQAVRP